MNLLEMLIGVCIGFICRAGLNNFLKRAAFDEGFKNGVEHSSNLLKIHYENLCGHVIRTDVFKDSHSIGIRSEIQIFRNEGVKK